MRFAMVPEGTNRAASLPSISARRRCRRFTVGSSPKTLSPTSAAAMQALMPGVGRVTVSLRKSRYSAATKTSPFAAAHRRISLHALPSFFLLCRNCQGQRALAQHFVVCPLRLDPWPGITPRTSEHGVRTVTIACRPAPATGDPRRTPVSRRRPRRQPPSPESAAATRSARLRVTLTATWSRSLGETETRISKPTATPRRNRISAPKSSFFAHAGKSTILGRKPSVSENGAGLLVGGGLPDRRLHRQSASGRRQSQ